MSKFKVGDRVRKGAREYTVRAAKDSVYWCEGRDGLLTTIGECHLLSVAPDPTEVLAKLERLLANASVTLLRSSDGTEYNIRPGHGGFAKIADTLSEVIMAAEEPCVRLPGAMPSVSPLG